MMDGLLTPANTSTVEELEKVFVFCMIWAMGSALTVSDDGTDYQKLFSDWWRGEWKKVSSGYLVFSASCLPATVMQSGLRQGGTNVCPWNQVSRKPM